MSWWCCCGVRQVLGMRLCVIGASALIVAGGQAVGSPVIGTYAQMPVMVADGTTVYTAWVYADNRGEGSPTWGTQHSFFLPPWATLIGGGLGVAYGKPDPARDFFEGKPMVFETFFGPNTATGRLVDPSFMPIDKIGDLEFYKFTLSPNAPVGPGNFDLGPDTVMTNMFGGPEPVTKVNHGFIITKIPGDMNYDGFVGIEDLNLVLGQWNDQSALPSTVTGDSSGDRFVGIEDLNWVLGNWNAGTPPGSAQVVPEPSGLWSLMLAGCLLRRRGRVDTVDTCGR